MQLFLHNCNRVTLNCLSKLNVHQDKCQQTVHIQICKFLQKGLKFFQVPHFLSKGLTRRKRTSSSTSRLKNLFLPPSTSLNSTIYHGKPHALTSHHDYCFNICEQQKVLQYFAALIWHRQFSVWHYHTVSVIQSQLDRLPVFAIKNTRTNTENYVSSVQLL